MSVPKLLYFDIPGKAEAIRLCFTYAGIPFEDYRFKDREEFLAMKTSGKLVFGQVPALEVEDVILTQSTAILRYVAKLKAESALYPADPILAARVDAICDQESDAFMGLRVAKYKGRFGFKFLEDDKFKEQLDDTLANLNSEVIPRHLDALVAALKAGGTDWLAGTKGPSIADFCWAPVLKGIHEGKFTGDAKVLDAFPDLVAFLHKFYTLPAIAEYYKDTPETIDFSAKGRA
ncbi:hypothetical protein CTAYLR_002867 [Chrysophaeum taylorii]|uniref:Glutathione S-transferase n=1 Tax=Chrysophaeum taylorii TaxID=2483200 RepID=A0AAD7XHV7_9STRA|nr:hypothetical protein CTAYLR_002867 [Chrysophaeum taylorii]